MGVKFHLPFPFCMDVIAREDRIPSFCVSLGVSVNQFQQKIEVETECWIHCDVWEDFIRSLGAMNDDSAYFCDFDEKVKVSFLSNKDGYLFQVGINKKSVAEDISSLFFVEGRISSGDFDEIRSKFLQVKIHEGQ